MIDTGSKRPVFLFHWGVRQAHWLYAELEQMQQWERDMRR